MWLSCVCAGLALLWARISGAAFGSPGSGAPPRLLAALRRAVLTVSPLAQHLPVGARRRYCGYLVSARGWLYFGYAFLGSFLRLLLAGLQRPHDSDSNGIFFANFVAVLSNHGSVPFSCRVGGCTGDCLRVPGKPRYAPAQEVGSTAPEQVRRFKYKVLQ